MKLLVTLARLTLLFHACVPAASPSSALIVQSPHVKVPSTGQAGHSINDSTSPSSWSEQSKWSEASSELLPAAYDSFSNPLIQSRGPTQTSSEEESEATAVSISMLTSSVLVCNVRRLTGQDEASKLLAWIDMQVQEVVRRVAMPPAKARRQQMFVANLTRAVKCILGADAELRAYGSAAAGFGSVDSDLDLQLSLSSKRKQLRTPMAVRGTYLPRVLVRMQGKKTVMMRRRENIRMLKVLSHALRSRFGLKAVAILRARVPLVTVQSEDATLSFDISVHEEENFGRFAVNFLEVMRRVDERVKEVVLAVKTWSKRREINEAFRGTLNSFSLIIMVLFVLQRLDPPILPNLFLPVLPLRGAAAERARKARRREEVVYDVLKPIATIRGVDGQPKMVMYHQDADLLQGWGSDNKQTAGEILLRFFAFFALEFNWSQECLSIREGRTRKVQETAFPSSERFHVFIEDFLDESNNVARCVDQAGRQRIEDEFRRAYDTLCAKGDFEALLQSPL
mmetsp:Transcript_45798/g.143686  ORF Transcript_45798/g.143686 Transcript_45798/m.143686 type:complete len:510 (-) Transcript_45798:111-1640(-)